MKTLEDHNIAIIAEKNNNPKPAGVLCPVCNLEMVYLRPSGPLLIRPLFSSLNAFNAESLEEKPVECLKCGRQDLMIVCKE